MRLPAVICCISSFTPSALAIMPASSTSKPSGSRFSFCEPIGGTSSGVAMRTTPFFRMSSKASALAASVKAATDTAADRASRPATMRLMFSSLQRRHRCERDAEILLVQPVDLAVHHVEEDELVEPTDQRMFSHAHAHVGGAATDGELEFELLSRVALLQVGDDQRVGGEQLGLARQIGCGRRGVVLGAHDGGLGGHRRERQLLRRAIGGGDFE